MSSGSSFFGLAWDDDSAAAVERDERRPVARAVHERWRREQADGFATWRTLHDLGHAGDRFAAGYAAAEGCEEDVFGAPQHPFRHASRAASVDHVEVVVGRHQIELRVAGAGEGLLVVPRSREKSLTAPVRDLEEERHRRQVGQDALQRWCETRVIDDGACARVLEEIAELVLHVPIVDVHCHGTRLRSADHALEILVAVVHVERDVVLARLPRREVAPFAVAAEPGVDQQMGELTRAPLQIAPGGAARGGDDRFAFGNRGRQSLRSGQPTCMPWGCLLCRCAVLRCAREHESRGVPAFHPRPRQRVRSRASIRTCRAPGRAV